MNTKGWRLSFSVMVILLMGALIMKWIGSSGAPLTEVNGSLDVDPSLSGSAVTDVRVFFPPLQGMTYYFAGEGMEYASFTRQITFTTPDAVQVEDRSGTNLAQVVEYGPEGLRIIWSEEEFYSKESLLDDTMREGRSSGGPRDLLLLKAPVMKGNTWRDASFDREIIAADEIVTIPLGTFYEVVTVKSRSIEADDFVMYEYYAKNIGLIKRVSLYVQDEKTYAVVSNLQSLACPRPQF